MVTIVLIVVAVAIVFVVVRAARGTRRRGDAGDWSTAGVFAFCRRFVVGRQQ